MSRELLDLLSSSHTDANLVAVATTRQSYVKTLPRDHARLEIGVALLTGLNNCENLQYKQLHLPCVPFTIFLVFCCHLDMINQCLILYVGCFLFVVQSSSGFSFPNLFVICVGLASFNLFRFQSFCLWFISLCCFQSDTHKTIW